MRYSSSVAEAFMCDTVGTVKQVIHPSVFDILGLSPILPPARIESNADVTVITFVGSAGQLMLHSDGVRVQIFISGQLPAFSGCGRNHRSLHCEPGLLHLGAL